MSTIAQYGQEKAANVLLRLANAQHVPHALLISGKEGWGALPLAIAFARFLLCERPTASGGICDSCAACQKSLHLVHPDLHFTFPSFPPKPGEKTNSKHFLGSFRSFFEEHPYGSVEEWLAYIKASDRQKGNISADECREIIEKLFLKPAEGRYKIQIIWRPEYLGKEGNILLKMIEEPPPQTIFILVAEEPDKLLETILSRTQLVRLHPFPSSEIKQILMGRYEVDERDAQPASLLAEGSVVAALQFAQHQDEDLLELTKEWFNGIFTFNSLMISKWVEKIDKRSTVQQKNLLTFVQHLMAHALRLQLAPQFIPPLSDAERQFVQKISARQFSLDTYQKIDDAIGKAVYHLLRNANKKIVLMHLSIQMQYFIKGLTLPA